METLKAKAICLILVLTTQVIAERFTTIEPDVFRTGGIYYAQQYPTLTGYDPQNKQIAALGEKKSAYANLILIGGRDTLLNASHTEKIGTYNLIISDSAVLGIVHPFSAPNVFITSSKDTIHDNSVTAVAVLDSFSDSKKTAIVAFASLRKLVIMQIAISANGISSSILSSINMPESMWETNMRKPSSTSVIYNTRRLAILGTSQNGANKVYHFATGNPLSKNGNGRVDFFNITEGTWVFLQPNISGLASGTNGLVFNDSAYFGKDLTIIDNFDKKGGKALAVLLPESKQYPQSALYVFPMDNDWTPSAMLPTVMAGSSKPWLEDSRQRQDCNGLGIANWGDETTHLLVSCRYDLIDNDDYATTIVIIKDIVLDSAGNISTSSVFSSEKMSYTNVPGGYYAYSNPISIKNHKNDLHSISLAARSSIQASYSYYMATFTLVDADYSKNFSIAAGTQEAIINIDSLFYRSGTTGFSAKTLFGSAKCEIQGALLVCQGSEKAIGSWSGIELSSSGNCDSYKACKRKDTAFVYVHSASEPSNTALRIPKNILVPYYGQVNFGDLKPLSYFRNPELKNTNVSWNVTGLKLSAVTNTPERWLAIIPSSTKEGIDTLVFQLSFSSTINNYPVHLHIADTSKILRNAIPATPGSDTVWNTAAKRYIALPRSSSKGDAYTYDIAQDSLGIYAEITGDYLHILRVDIADVSVAYTENGLIKHRKITLMPELNVLPLSLPPSNAASQARSLNAAHIGGGLQINGLNGDFELRAYNFKGEEIQREKANAGGSVFVKLRQNCPQIVQIRSGNEKISMKIVN